MVLGFSQGGMQGEERKWPIFGLKIGQRHDIQGNVATLQRGLKPTSRRLNQRRDVIEWGTKRRHDVRGNVATLQRVGLKHVATLSINVATFQRLIKIHVATLITHVVTFQRVSKSTSRRWKSTSRRYRDN